VVLVATIHIKKSCIGSGAGIRVKFQDGYSQFSRRDGSAGVEEVKTVLKTVHY
jgi:hypothetical protein